MSNPIPLYADLPVIEETGEHHSWDVFGRSDELGTLNFLRPETVAAAAHAVKEGRVVCLSLPLNLPYPALARARPPYTHTVTRTRGGRDDSLSGFFLQASSQWDGLQHIRYREFGYYGGREEEELDTGVLGIHVMAQKGIIGRGVLIDVACYAQIKGLEYSPTKRFPVSPAMFEEILTFQGTTLKHGDILILRTGWLGWYLSLDQAGREDMQGRQKGGEGGMQCPGFEPSTAMAGWLWDHQIAAVAADNPALETMEVRKEEGFLHRRILSLLGMPIGEFFLVEELSEACAARGDWSFMLSSAPLNLPGGVGSPNNAYAIL